MILLGSFIGGWEIVLILSIIFVLLCAKRLPDALRGFRMGIREFMKATREVTDEITEALDGQKEIPSPQHAGHYFLAGLTILLGAVCLALILYEVSK